jgi:hypothetical protein
VTEVAGQLLAQESRVGAASCSGAALVFKLRAQDDLARRLALRARQGGGREDEGEQGQGHGAHRGRGRRYLKMGAEMELAAELARRSGRIDAHDGLTPDMLSATRVLGG